MTGSFFYCPTVIIRNKMNISEKQLAVLNKAPNASVACVLAKFFADKKCDLSQANKISLAEHIVSIKDKDVAIGTLNITPFSSFKIVSLSFPVNSDI